MVSLPAPPVRVSLPAPPTSVIVSGAALQDVVSVVAGEGVVSGPALQRVVPRAARQRIVESVAGALERAGAGEDEVLEIGAQRERAERGADRIRAGVGGFGQLVLA